MSFDGRFLSGIGVLAAVVESGSFVRAADALGLTQPGVSRAIARLESRMGVRLLDRTTRSVSLTAEGRSFYEEITPLLAEIDRTVAQTSGSAQIVRGRLRINVDPFFSQLIIAPKIDRFLRQYPEVSVELIASDSLGDLVSEGFDLAIRFIEPTVSSLVALKLLETQVMTVAAPRYLKDHGRPGHPDELSGHQCLHFRNSHTGQPFPWEFRKGQKVINSIPKGRLLLTDPESLLGACVSGAGVAQVLRFYAKNLLSAGKLIELFPDWSDETFPLYALYPSKRLPPAKIRAFIEFVNEMIESYQHDK